MNPLSLLLMPTWRTGRPIYTEQAFPVYKNRNSARWRPANYCAEMTPTAYVTAICTITERTKMSLSGNPTNPSGRSPLMNKARCISTPGHPLVLMAAYLRYVRRKIWSGKSNWCQFCHCHETAHSQRFYEPPPNLAPWLGWPEGVIDAINSQFVVPSTRQWRQLWQPGEAALADSNHIDLRRITTGYLLNQMKRRLSGVGDERRA